MKQVVDSLLDVYSGEQLVIMQIFDDRQQDHSLHLALLAALRDRSPRGASRLMRRHLGEVRAVIEARLASQLPRESYGDGREGP